VPIQRALSACNKHIFKSDESVVYLSSCRFVVDLKVWSFWQAYSFDAGIKGHVEGLTAICAAHVNQY